MSAPLVTGLYKLLFSVSYLCLLALSLFPTRASKPTLIVVLYLPHAPLSSSIVYGINERAYLSSLIHCHWWALLPFIVSMNRFLHFPSLRTELSSYLIPKQDSTSEQVIIIVSQQVTSSPLPRSSIVGSVFSSTGGQPIIPPTSIHK